MHAAIPLAPSAATVTRSPAGPGASEAIQALYRTLFLCGLEPEERLAGPPDPQPREPGPGPQGSD